MSDCIFCKISNGEIPAAKVYEDDSTIAFLDIAPATPRKGHVLVIPKKHADIIVDMDDESANAVMIAIRKVSQALLKWADGLNILQNNGKTAGQLVNHVHFHLVPRFTDDGVDIGRWQSHEYEEGEMAKMQEKIKKLLNEA